MRPNYPALGTVDEVVALLRRQANTHVLERRDGSDASPWAWLQTALLYENGRESDIGEAFCELLLDPDPQVLRYTIDQLYRSPPKVLAPIWERLGKIGPSLEQRSPDCGTPLHDVLLYLKMGSSIPALPDDAVLFLTGLDETSSAWATSLIIAAGSRPSTESQTLANAVERMSDAALEELAQTVLVEPRIFAAKPLDAIAALADAPKQRFKTVLKKVVDERENVRTILSTATSGAERQLELRDEAQQDAAMGIDWTSLEARLQA